MTEDEFDLVLISSANVGDIEVIFINCRRQVGFEAKLCP